MNSMMDVAVKIPAILSTTPDKITIAGGLPPFVKACRYYIHPKHQSPPFLRIECEDQDLSFLLVDPFLLECGYKPEFFDADFEEIGLKSGDSTLVLAIVNLNRGIEFASCNLVGPILLNPANGRGKQVVLKNNTLFSSRHPLFKSKG
ncbi:MAG: flagellar assembly protein FliW [Planctomycetota bacterium]